MEEMQAYSELIALGQPDFVEVKVGSAACTSYLLVLLVFSAVTICLCTELNELQPLRDSMMHVFIYSCSVSWCTLCLRCCFFFFIIAPPIAEIRESPDLLKSNKVESVVFYFNFTAGVRANWFEQVICSFVRPHSTSYTHAHKSKHAETHLIHSLVCPNTRLPHPERTAIEAKEEKGFPQAELAFMKHRLQGNASPHPLIQNPEHISFLCYLLTQFHH